MPPKKVLHFSEIKDVLSEARQKKTLVVGSLLIEGQWRLLSLRVYGCSDNSIILESQSPCQEFKHHQPIGISIHLGHFKYLFDSTIQKTDEMGPFGRIFLDFPDTIEQVERRAYHRQPVPRNTTVKVIFWHRGYLDASDNEPAENYWEGMLLNLSARGAQFEIKTSHQEYFKLGQVLGIQFTPMSYQKPLLLESHVKYVNGQPSSRPFRIGVEFLGLEASPERRADLDRILEIVAEYEKTNQQA